MATSSVQRLTVSEPFLRLGSLLAEGPFYRPEDDTLHFVDIKGKLLHCVPLSGSTPPKALQIEDMLGVACLIEGDNDNYIVAAKKGFGLVNQETGQLTYLSKVFPDAESELRLSRLHVWRPDMVD
jgi:sugar lactone lactonase YvrE